MKVSESLKRYYIESYSGKEADCFAKTKARFIGGKFKAKNIFELSKLIEFDSILEVGCGEGTVLYWLSEWNVSQNLFAVEISETAISSVKEKTLKIFVR
jgi:tRNA G46 methylase TrmB